MTHTITLDPITGKFALTLPNGHTVSIPVSEKGVRALRDILSFTTTEGAEPAPKIGNDAAPVQHMVDEWLRAGNTPTREMSTFERKYGVKLTLPDFDDDEDFSI